MMGFSLLPSAILVLFAFVFVLELSQANVFFPSAAAAATVQPMGGENSLKKEECEPACKYRCSETSHKKPCMFFCKMCCSKCLCVPSGTYGNKDECPCYRDWKTKEGGPKCP